MIIDISVACIAVAFIVLVIFLIIGISRFSNTSKEISKLLSSTKKDVDKLTIESAKLVKKLNDSATDIKEKLHALDRFFKPLHSIKQTIHTKGNRHKSYNLTSEIIEGLSAGIVLYDKIKGGIKEFSKSR